MNAQGLTLDVKELVSLRRYGVAMLDVQIWIERDVEDPAQALPFIDIVVGGRAVRALLDSGAGRTTVEAPSDAALETRPPEGTGVFGGQGDRRVWRTTVQIGNRCVGPIDLDAREADEGRDLVGQDVLSRFRCEYRLDQELLRLDGAPPPHAQPVFVDRGGHVYVDLVWPGVTASAVLDTGASVSVVDATFAAAHPYLVAKKTMSQGTDSAGTTMDTAMVDLSGPHIFGRAFTSTVAAIVDLDAVNRTIERRMDLIIGWPILHQANWVIDHATSSAALTE